MEEVWKDINLASLNDQNRRPMTTHSTLGGAILQDFLARPFNLDPPKNMLSVSSSSSSQITSTVSLYCPVSSPTPPPLVTALSLNSRPDFHHFDPLIPNGSSQLLMHPHHHNATTPKVNVSCFGGSNPSPFETVTCTVPSSSLPCFGHKRFAEPASADCSSNHGDRRTKRMIKNRESAARSRARKQAYTNELEQKVQLLAEENARLKRQQQELWEAAKGQQKKKGSSSSLYRTSTAPF